MKTPTLKQLKRRPALWFCVEDSLDFFEPRITMPNGGAWFYDQGAQSQWMHFKHGKWHEHAIGTYEFAGWL